MPLVFSKDPKTGKKTSRYVAPKPKLSRREQREQRAAAYGTGGKFEDNFMRRLFGGAGNRLDQRDDARQIERLKKYPEQAGERYRQVQRNVADAAATGGFDFDALFSPRAVEPTPTPTMTPAQDFGQSLLGDIRGGSENKQLIDEQINAMGYQDNSELFKQRMLDLANAKGEQSRGQTFTDAYRARMAVNPYVGADTRSFMDRITSNPYGTNQTTQVVDFSDRAEKDQPLLSRTPAQVDYQNMFPSSFLNAADVNKRTGYFQNIVPRERATRGLLGGLPFSVDVARFDPYSLAGLGGGNTALQNLADQYYNVNLVGNKNIPYSERNKFLNIGNLGMGYTPTGGLLTGGQQEAMLRERFGEFQKGYPDLQDYQLGIY
jgi:hypothetical protein